MELPILVILLLQFINSGVAVKNSYFKSSQLNVVETDKGPVIGEELTTVDGYFPYTAYKGIPYAEPPLEYLRFKPPVEKEPWTTPIVSHDANLCIQIDYRTQNIIGSDDCLYLNVFVPKTKRKGLKNVMVWIHGGAYKTGNSNSSFYGPDFLLSEKVIVVSFNYRLGPLGFLNLNHEDAYGNMGLKDQNLALKWVQRNIKKFGGDPNKVTIFGQSAGSVSVDLHVLSDMSVGLFQKSISMSGSTLCIYWGFQNSIAAEHNAFLLGENLGIKTKNKDKLLLGLHKASAHDIIESSRNIPFSKIPFRPSIERSDIAVNEPKFLTQCTLSKYYSGNFTKGPHMMGYTANEAISFVDAKYVDGLTISDGILNPSKFTMDSVERIGALETILRFPNDTKPIPNIALQFTSDIMFAAGIDTKQRLLAMNNGGHPIYYYRFSFDHHFSAHKSDGINLEGVGHEDELPYIFHRPFLQIPPCLPKIRRIRRKLVRMLANFAKYGNPTPKNDNFLRGLEWPASGLEGTYLEIGEQIFAQPIRPVSPFVKFLESIQLPQLYYLNDCDNQAAISIMMQGSLKTMQDIAEIPLDLLESAGSALKHTVLSIHQKYQELTHLDSPYPEPLILPVMHSCPLCSKMYISSGYNNG